METFVNKVAESGIITIDLEAYIPDEIQIFDLKDHLFMGLILKEKDFREALKKEDWEKYSNKDVAITCSQDAVIPMWAYMLVSSYLQPYASDIYFGDELFTRNAIINKTLSKIDVNEYAGKRVVIKGCGEKEIPASAYVEITKLLRPVAKSIMYGEPCSTVPIFKSSTVAVQ
jgi:hypothetical protein